MLRMGIELTGALDGGAARLRFTAPNCAFVGSRLFLATQMPVTKIAIKRRPPPTATPMRVLLSVDVDCVTGVVAGSVAEQLPSSESIML